MRLRRLSLWQPFVGGKATIKKNVALGTLMLAFMRYMEHMHQAEMSTIHGQAPRRRSILTALVTREV
jgi:hypothetical protein